MASLTGFGPRAQVVARWAVSAVRHHYMVGVTTVVLGVASAGALGYFDGPVVEHEATRPVQDEPPPAIFVPGVARTPVPARAFEFNVFLVSTPEHQMVLQLAENTYRSPYLIGGRASEVLVVLTAEDEIFAAHHVEEVRATFPGANVVVTDLR
jgi:hypothetical protein